MRRNEYSQKDKSGSPERGGLCFGVSPTFLSAMTEKARSTHSQASPGYTSLENTMEVFVFSETLGNMKIRHYEALKTSKMRSDSIRSELLGKAEVFEFGQHWMLFLSRVPGYQG